MKGCTVAEFIDDLLTMGGPEKEFVFTPIFEPTCFVKVGSF